LHCDSLRVQVPCAPINQEILLPAAGETWLWAELADTCRALAWQLLFFKTSQEMSR
jgi:hypothetical protein